MRVLRTFLISVIAVAAVCLLLITPREAGGGAIGIDSDESGTTVV
jgi:hypothetical protein